MVTHRSFANACWTLSPPGVASKRSREVLASATRRSTAGGAKDRVDRGLEAGLTSAERAELISAHRRIRELETELAVHRRASELMKGPSVPDTKNPVEFVYRLAPRGLDEYK